MSNLRLSKSNPTYFGAVVWLAIGIVLFGVLYLVSGPRGAAERELRAAGPDGVTAFFASPEAAVHEINMMLEAHSWTRLARFYDFTGSTVPMAERISGAYFAGGLPASSAPTQTRPFPPGWRFLYAEPAAAENVVRVVIAPPGTGEPEAGTTRSFMMRRFPEGYRIIPEDAAQWLPSGPSAP